MSLAAEFAKLSPTSLADALTRDRVMDIGIRPLWAGMPRVAGPAYTVRCAPGDNLMVHAAIYRAAPGDVIVVEAGDVDYAVAGGNVCAVAQRHGVAGFVVDGVIRDVAEARERGFPVLARGVIPIPGAKDRLGALGGPVRVGGVEVHAGRHRGGRRGGRRRGADRARDPRPPGRPRSRREGRGHEPRRVGEGPPRPHRRDPEEARLLSGVRLRLPDIAAPRRPRTGQVSEGEV